MRAEKATFMLNARARGRTRLLRRADCGSVRTLRRVKVSAAGDVWRQSKVRRGDQGSLGFDQQPRTNYIVHERQYNMYMTSYYIIYDNRDTENDAKGARRD